MNLKITAVIFLCLLNGACTKDIPNPQCDLDEFSLEANGWTPIKGSVNIGCELYLEAFIWKEETYYFIGSHCIDMAFAPFRGCDGALICESPQSTTCRRFFEEKTDLGIVAYRAE